MLMTKKYSFRFILSGLFTLLMLFVGGMIGMLNYVQIENILLSSANEMYKKTSDKTVLNHHITYNPVKNSIELLAHISLASSKTLDQRLSHIGAVVSALDTEKSVSAIHFSYKNGEFFIVKKLLTNDQREEALREKIKIPVGTNFIVENRSIEKSGNSILTRLFVDKNLKVIEKRNPVADKFDPRTRLWYKQASQQPKVISPYYFSFSHEVGTTVVMKMFHSDTVIAADITLENISTGLKESIMTPRSELYLVTANGDLIASSNSTDIIDDEKNNRVSLKKISDFDSEVLKYFSTNKKIKQGSLSFELNDEEWKGAVRKIGRLGGHDLYLLMFTPIDDFLKEAYIIRDNNFILLLVIILLAFPVIWYISRRISLAMQRLSADANKIINFDFSESMPLTSRIKEVNDLNNAQCLMKASLSQFMGLINSLAIEKDFNSLLEKITLETLNASKADAVATYLLDKNNKLHVDAVKFKNGVDFDISCLPELSFNDDSDLLALIASDEIKYLYQNAEKNKQWSRLATKLKDEKLQLIVLPLRNRQAEFMGLVVLAYAHKDQASLNDQPLAFVQAFSEFAAVSLESKQLLKMQEDLLDAFIGLIAEAIDAKSPYTGGHCQRVPVITKMLAQAACESNHALFSDYQLSEEQRQEIHIASMLHDCGKITTPEYVVDKATKLETIYDRIHEIRTRFEVLKRDAEIDYWKALSAGGDEVSLSETLKQRLQLLDEDFEFVATCNQGGEFMEDEKIERLNKISNIRWMRTLNKQSGVSWEEKKRMHASEKEKLPVEEKLLSDKTEHIIKREAADVMPTDNQWGFKLDEPEHKFNLGELYNLSIKRGTLSNEERFIINGHMVQTIKMLEELPYPSHLKNVPIIAGCHHESMDGTGYPKRLSKEDMPLTARMMAIADIYEALTASDRPYKKAKTISESVRIMNSMRNNNHIDSDLFELFLSSGVYLKYAEQFLEKDQIDTLDINQYLSA